MKHIRIDATTKTELNHIVKYLILLVQKDGSISLLLNILGTVIGPKTSYSLFQSLLQVLTAVGSGNSSREAEEVYCMYIHDKVIKLLEENPELLIQ